MRWLTWNPEDAVQARLEEAQIALMRALQEPDTARVRELVRRALLLVQAAEVSLRA